MGNSNEQERSNDKKNYPSPRHKVVYSNVVNSSPLRSPSKWEHERSVIQSPKAKPGSYFYAGNNERVKEESGRVAQIDRQGRWPGGGLKNIGNTCFLNSTLQCLFKIDALNQALLNTKGKSVLSEYIALYNKTKISTSASSTYDLKRALAYKTHMFSGYAQEDAHQFFITLVNSLHQQCNRVRSKPKYEELNSHLDYEKGGQIWWNYNRKIDDSVVYDCLLGQLLSVVQCQECKEKSIAFDQFLSLQLSVKSSFSSCDLKQLIRDFLAVERISQFRCQREKRKTKCRRKLTLWRLPTVLVIHLKRFEFGGYFRRKLQTKVKYPAELNLSQFVENSRHQSMRQPVYHLVGVVKHEGRIDGGHYTAEAMAGPGRWYQFNDQYVRSTEPTLEGSSPYMLFYTRR